MRKRRRPVCVYQFQLYVADAPVIDGWSLILEYDTDWLIVNIRMGGRYYLGGQFGTGVLHS